MCVINLVQKSKDRSNITCHGHHIRINDSLGILHEDGDYGILPYGVAAAIDTLLNLTPKEIETVLQIARGHKENWSMKGQNDREIKEN